MKWRTNELRLFFFSQPFEDGLRTTIAVLLPSLVLSYMDQFQLGLTVSLGAACVSLTDAPGPIVHRKNTMLFCLLFIFLVGIITGFARFHLLSMALTVFVLSFFFSMFNVYGLRASAIGNAALLTLVLTMDKPAEPLLVVENSFYIFCGGLWYMLISLLTYKARPYRTAQRTLGESIRELARFLTIKADFYDTSTDLDEDYKKLLLQQMVVSDKQEATREVLFKTRQIVEESTPEGRRLVLAFIGTVDLFEDIMATYYDYRLLRKQYGQNGILDKIYAVAKELSIALDEVGKAILSNTPYTESHDFTAKLSNIKRSIDELSQTTSGTTPLILVKMLINIRRIVQRYQDLLRYFSNTTEVGKENKAKIHTLFVSHQSLDPKLFWNNLNFSSSVFRHALRVAIACVLGFVVAKSFARGYHSYWILMTVTFMLKPSFSLTRQRNIERITGTLIGGTLGFLLLLLHPSRYMLFGVMVVLMVATYSLQRIKYLASIICMTPFILILFHFLGIGFQHLLQERIIDTLVGCIIAFLAGYLLFPDWESKQLNNYLYQILKANIAYLKKAVEALEGKTINATDYKLARKEVYVQTANLSAAFQRMISEPSSKQKNKKEIHHFVVLNHILSSNIASIAGLLSERNVTYSEKIIRASHKSLSVLAESLELFGDPEPLIGLTEIHLTEPIPNTDELLLKDQLEFIYKLAIDIKKTAVLISSETTQSPVRNPSALSL